MAQETPVQETPVAMIVFNRPDTTARVFEVVRAARPRRLLVVADAPRRDRPGEEERCAAVRAIFDRVDWPCAVERCFSEENLGCRRRVSSGLDWIFSRCEEAIVLEDDCVPHPTFFPYCEALLAHWRDEPRVMAITGDNFQRGQLRGEGSYYFSHIPHVWGWASWRRAWAQYDVSLRSWPERRGSRWLEELLGSRRAAAHWTQIFDDTHAGKIDTWDHQWLYTMWERDGLVATPNVNLVSNIGGGPGAAHTTNAADPLLNLPVHPIELPLRHPPVLALDPHADPYMYSTVFRPRRRRGLVGRWDKLGDWWHRQRERRAAR
jgi:hypothetical protein